MSGTPARLPDLIGKTFSIKGGQGLHSGQVASA
jgi:hypothetical protein